MKLNYHIGGGSGIWTENMVGCVHILQKKCEIVDMGPTMISVLANHTSKSVRILSCVTFFFSVSDDEGLIVTELRPL